MSLVRSVRSAFFDIARDTLRVSRDLYLVMIPAIVAVKVLQEFDLIRYLALPLQPLMNLVGLPAEMGLAWAAALLNGVYAGIIIFLQLAQGSAEPLSVAQVTTLGAMMLIAHGLPVEAGIAHRCGARFLGQAVIRVGVALAFGIAYSAFTSATGMYQDVAAIPLPGAAADPSIAAWALGEAKKLLSISVVIFTLLVAMRCLRAVGALNAISRAMEPVMRLIGIGAKASTITMIGMTLGLSYGSGIILKDARSGELAPEDVFFSLSFMGICHSLIEDTVLMLLIGAEINGVLWIRLAACLLFTAVLVRLVRRLPEAAKTRFLWMPRQAAA
ncbi:nucleoside recognition domain-containing protein [Oleispirillum naphthae]|uniref:nucleoside recognition domain-containing protein n=1 Tax=Oleispirillum naphthae TaxID=2838853 RepID=UPI003082452B